MNEFKQKGGKITSFAWYSPDTVLASFACVHGNYGGVMISVDGGDSFYVWNAVPRLCANIVTVADRNTTNERVIFIGYGNRDNATDVACMLWNSLDGGATWDSCVVTGGTTSQNTRNVIYDIATASGDADTLFLACEYGIAVSTDGGATAAIKSFPSPAGLWEICAVAIDKNDKHNVYCASREKIYLYDWHNPESPALSEYFSALPGEKITDMLFDGLTMGSSIGFFGFESANLPGNTLRPKAAALIQHMSVRGTRAAGIKVKYAITAPADVTVTLKDVAGRTLAIRTLHHVRPGIYTEILPARRVARGMYVVSLQTGASVRTMPYVLLR